MGKQRIKDSQEVKYHVYRDGDLVGANLSGEEVDSYICGMSSLYPDSVFNKKPVKTKKE